LERKGKKTIEGNKEEKSEIKKDGGNKK